MSPAFSGQRHLGLVLATMGWCTLAAISIFLPIYASLFNASGTVNLFFFHLAITITFFLFGLPYGIKFFICNNPKLVMFRGFLAVLGFFCFFYSKIWSPQTDHYLLYSISPLWVVLILLITNYKITKLSLIGIVVSVVGVCVIYYDNAHSWPDFANFTFGILSGALSSFIILITYILIKTDHTSRIGFYHGIIGCIFSLCILFYYFLTDSIMLPPAQEIIIALFLGLAYSLALFCFIQSAFYVEAYVVGVSGYSLIFFTETLNWIMTKELISISSIIGIVLIVFGGIKAVLGTFVSEEKKRLNI